MLPKLKFKYPVIDVTSETAEMLRQVKEIKDAMATAAIAEGIY